MLDRTKLNTLFTDAFFKAVDLDKEKAMFTTPVPASRNDDVFEKFLASEDGEKSRAVAQRLLDELEAWSKANNINDEKSIDALKVLRTKFKYPFKKGNSIENEEAYALCTEGLFHLTEIVRLLQSDELAQDHKRDKIQILYRDLFKNICATGVHTHLAKTYHRLKGDLGSILMEVRSELAGNIVLELIKKFNAEDPAFLVTEGDEIHCVNYVLNNYANSLGIIEISDKRIPNSISYELEKLKKAFPEELYKLLSLDYVIQQVVDKADPGAIVKQMKILNGDTSNLVIDDKINPSRLLPGQIFNQLCDKFQLFLESCGVTNFKFNTILDQDQLAEGIYQFATDLNAYTIMLISQGLGTKGFLDLSTMIHKSLTHPSSASSTDKSVTLSFIPSLDLKFAYVTDKEMSQPFIPYFIERCKQGDMSVLEIFANDGHRQREICAAVCKQLQTERDIKSCTKLFANPVMSTYLKAHCQMIHLVDLALCFPLDQRKDIFNILEIDLSFLIILTKDPEFFGKIIQFFDEEHWGQVFDQLGKPAVLSLLKNSGLTSALNQLPHDKRIIFLDKVINYCNEAELDTLFDSSIKLINMLNQLPKDTILPKALRTYLHKCLQTPDQVRAFLRGMNHAASCVFFNNLDKEVLPSIITNFEDSFLATIIIRRSPLKFIASDKIILLFQNLQAEHLQTLFNNIVSLQKALVLFSDKGCELIFAKLGKNHLQKIVPDVSSLCNIFTFPEEFTTNQFEALRKKGDHFLKTLTPDYLKSIFQNTDSVIQLFNTHNIICTLLLEHLGKEHLQTLFADNTCWAALIRIKNKENMFSLLKILGPDGFQKIFPDMKSLNTGLRALKRETNVSHLKLFEILDHTHLLGLATNLTSSLKILDIDYRSAFLIRLGKEQLSTLIPDHKSFTTILQLLGDKHDLLLIRSLDQQHLRRLITNHEELIAVLKCTKTVSSRHDTLRELITCLGKDYLGTILQSTDNIDKLVDKSVLLPKDGRQFAPILRQILAETNENKNKRKATSPSSSPTLFKKQQTESTKSGKEEVKPMDIEKHPNPPRQDGPHPQ